MGYNHTNDFDQLSYMIFLIIKFTRYPRNVKIQKIIFIYEEEFNKGFFRFGEDNYGPFSEEVANAINILVANGYIKDMETKYNVTDKGEKIFEKLCAKSYSNFDVKYFKILLNLFSDWDSNELIKFVYNKYPEYTGRSIIIDKLSYEESDYEEINNKYSELEAIKNDWKEFTKQNN